MIIAIIIICIITTWIMQVQPLITPLFKGGQITQNGIGYFILLAIILPLSIYLAYFNNNSQKEQERILKQAAENSQPNYKGSLKPSKPNPPNAPEYPVVTSNIDYTLDNRSGKFPKSSMIRIRGIRIPNYNQMTDITLKITIEDWKDGYASGMRPFFPKMTKAQLRQGINPFINTDLKIGHDDFPFILTAKGGMLYITTRFFDIENNHLIGKIEENKWDIPKHTVYTCLTDSPQFDKMEIIDNLGNIACSMKFVSPSELDIQGYFRDDKYILVLSGMSGIDSIDGPYWKTNCLNRIHTIKSIFK